MKLSIVSAESLQYPCQLYILSCKEYDLNLVIKTHNVEFGDIVSETIISPSKFDDDITNFLDQPTWKKLAENPTSKGDYNFLLQQLVMFGTKIRDRNFDRTSDITSFTGDSNLSTWELFCDAISLDLNKKAETWVNYPIEYFQSNTQHETPPNPTPQIQHHGFGAYFYPFIMIGNYEPTFRGQLTGSDFHKLDEYVHDSQFAGNRILVTRLGLVCIEIENPVLTNRIINTIFGTALLLGLPTHANSLNEIASVSLRDTAFVHSWQTTTLRTIMYDYRTRFSRLNLLKTPVSIDVINEIIKTAEQIWLDNKFTADLELYLQSQTHLNTSEFLQSFNTSWLVIEKYLRRKFNDKINIPSNGIRKYLERTDINRILDILKSDGEITPEEFKKYDELRVPRNRIFHGNGHPSYEETKECLEIALTLVRKETRIDKKFDFDSSDYVYI